MNEKENINDFLSGLREEEPFHVPDHYFDELPGRIMDRIQSNQPQRARAFSGRLMLAYALGIAFLIVTGVFVTKTLLDSRASVKPSRVEIAEFMDYYSSDFEEDQILEFMGKETPSDSLNRYEESIIHYLLDENIDIESIVDAL
jgi:hypothetical protein